MPITPYDVTAIVPTRGPKKLVEEFLLKLDHPSWRVILIVDEGREKDCVPVHPGLPGVFVISVPVPVTSLCHIQEIGFMTVRTSHFVSLGDDLTIAPGTIQAGVEAFNRYLPSGYGLVKLQHKSNGNDSSVACFPMMSKQFYVEHFHPTPYLYFWTDQEWGDVAKECGCYAEAQNVPIWNPSVQHHSREWEKDRQTYMERALARGQRNKAMSSLSSVQH
jgi:hypothetical protein